MAMDRRARRLLDMMAATGGGAEVRTSVADRRSGLIALAAMADDVSTPVAIEDRDVPGLGGPLPIRLYSPLEPAGAALPGLVFFHGGGWVAGNLETHDGLCRRLCAAAGCKIIALDYRLAPEHPFPAALMDCLLALNWVANHAASLGLDGSRLGVCGDSAGGTLAAATCQQFARTGTPRLALQLLICPILDYSRSTASRRDLASGYLVDQATLDHDLLHYAPPGTDPADPRISPLRAAAIGGLPPTLIHTAEFDPLRDEGRDYFERLARADTEVSYTCHPGMIHLFYGLGAVIPYARTAFEQIGGEIRAALA
jgi:acetyl esterase/lipase